MAAFTSLLGDSLLGKSGSVDTVSALSGKVVGLYFSAHWCPPCRAFTPQFADIYRHLVGDGGKNFEVVFVSSDRDEASFSSYYADMPWLALPFVERERKASLSQTFGVSGIPTLVILDADGKEITRDGRAAVLKDPSGSSFPWHPPTLWQLLGDHVTRNDGSHVDVASLRTKVFGLYFSAKWCPPCCRFTSNTLIGAYNTLKSRPGTEFEIVWVSLDRDNAEYLAYFQLMPWTSLGFKHPNAQELATRFGVSGIPSLVILDGANDAAIITKNGVAAISADTTLTDFPWHPKALNALDTADNEDLNERTCLVALLETAEPDELERTKAALTDIATAYKTRKPNMRFFFSVGCPLSARLRQMCALTQSPTLLLLDLPSYYSLEGQDGGDATSSELTKDKIESFLEFYEAGALVASSLDGR